MTDFDEPVPEETDQLDQDPLTDPQYSLNDRGLQDNLDEGYSPPENWSAAEGFGNTPAEMAEGETLDQRLTQEEPDLEVDDDPDFVDDGEVGDQRSGRLVEANEGIGEDDEGELYGEDVGIDGAAATAEEAAVHVVEDEDY